MERIEKTHRFEQLKKLAVSVISYWSILPVPVEEKVNFMPLFHYAKADSMDDVPEHREDFMKTVENECDRLEKLMADLILRKKSKLAQIYQMTHLEQPPSAGQGSSDISMAFELVMEQISIAKAHSMKRQDIVTRVEVLQNAWQEIQWYLNPDFDVNSPEDHERLARGKMLFDFFPKMVEDIEAKLSIWNFKEDDFSFDGVDVREKVNVLKGYHDDAMEYTVLENSEAEGVGSDMVPGGPEAGGIDLHQLAVPRQPRTPRGQVPVNVQQPPPPQPQEAEGVDIDMVPVGPEAGGIDLHQLAVPRQPRTPRVQVPVNVQQQPPPQPQVPLPPLPSPQASGGDSVASTTKSDSRDMDYDPSSSGGSDE